MPSLTVISERLLIGAGPLTALSKLRNLFSKKEGEAEGWTVLSEMTFAL